MCSNGTRVFVQKKIAEAFLDRLVEKTKNMKIGDPLQEDTVVGATISKEQAEKVLAYIDIAKREVRSFAVLVSPVSHTQHAQNRKREESRMSFEGRLRTAIVSFCIWLE